jgi:hypothetical protein
MKELDQAQTQEVTGGLRCKITWPPIKKPPIKKPPITTLAVGEEGGPVITTLALGEEGPTMTTMAVGEEGSGAVDSGATTDATPLGTF